VSRLFAAVYDPLMKASEDACLNGWRSELLSPLAGNVLEVGPGTGANLAHYTRGVTCLNLAEPDAAMRARLARRACVAPTTVLDASTEELPFAAGSFDAVVCTLVLCSARDPRAALAEIRRVLKPAGRLAFIEHVASDANSRRFRWQRRVEPLWKRLMGNCHLTRQTEETIRQAGFLLGDVRRESMRKAVPVVRPTIRGIAVRDEDP
jgi:ubiquinone/menaquinone biosynthesis C-methylase UbiE